MPLARSIITVILITVGAGGALAQSTAPQTAQVDEDRPYFIGEIVVSEREVAPPASGATDTLEAAEIRALGVNTVAEALQYLPGVSMSTGARNEQMVRVRGYEQNNVLVLVDGVPISDSYYGYADLGQLPVRDVARITVTRGAASPLYGPNGLGGVINISTYQGEGQGGVTGELRLSDNDTVLAHAASGGASGAVSWYVGGEFSTTDGFPLAGNFATTEFEDGGRRVNSDHERTSLVARVGWKIDSSSSLFASVRWIDAEKGIPFHTERPSGFLRYGRFSDWQQGTMTLGYQRAWLGGEIRAQLFSHAYDNTLAVYADPELDDLILESTFEDRVLGGFVVMGWRLDSRQWLDVALHLRRDDHTAYEAFPDGGFAPGGRYESDLLSLAAQDQFTLGSRWSAVAAVSLESFDVRRADSPDTGGGDQGLSHRRTLASPQAELRYQVTPEVLTTLSLYHRSRFPTFRQLFGTRPPNPDLEPQTTTGAGLGVRLAVGGAVQVAADLFSDHVRHLIARSSRFLPFENHDQAEIKGLEVSVDGHHRRLDWGAGFTVIDAEFLESVEGMQEVPLVPHATAEAGIRVPIFPRFEIRGSWRFEGRRVVYDCGERVELDPYSLLRVGGSFRLWDFELLAEVDNVLDADVEQEPGFPLEGRRLWLGVRFSVR